MAVVTSTPVGGDDQLKFFRHRLELLGEVDQIADGGAQRRRIRLHQVIHPVQGRQGAFGDDPKIAHRHGKIGQRLLGENGLVDPGHGIVELGGRLVEAPQQARPGTGDFLQIERLLATDGLRRAGSPAARLAAGVMEMYWSPRKPGLLDREAGVFVNVEAGLDLSMHRHDLAAFIQARSLRRFRPGRRP